ncbi:ATP-binding protein [Lentzea sp. BCCO 10_0798]|uniref:ATP-binding protein n=1 Tax=Lentzea kristufekii TaxID=3095430 RepID=A0ABU4TJK0_9PSEU|nr:ATP-binding protein [Lentzea sp. BCCO 10_0798]MDX8048457.1 ATP-binding protein [Lentzea sp. BCCO 10_0798]
MSESVDVLVERELTDGNPSVADERRLLRAALNSVDEGRVEDALLIMTELVENAYRHAVGARRLCVRLVRERDVIRIEVEDGSPMRLPVLGRHGHTDSDGAGLVIVNRLSAHWGCRRSNVVKTVWAEVSGLPAVESSSQRVH